MASLKKRGKYYYIKFSKSVNGETKENVKSLGIRYKKEAEKALETLEKLEDHGSINPYDKDFDPKQTLKELKQKDQKLDINTVRQAADYFYRRKSHLSSATVKNPDTLTQDSGGAYERAIEHFINKNDIAGLSPLLVKQHHFEAVIFKPDIKPPTRHFYFKQLRVWWNKLLDWRIVEQNFFPEIKKDLPPLKSNTKSKMLTENELHKLFAIFDKELERKLKRPEYDISKAQHWFKPLIAIYFYCGLRKHEAAYKSDLEYSGLQGKNLYYEDNQLEMIYLEATKGQRERIVPIPKKMPKAHNGVLETQGRGRFRRLSFYLSVRTAKGISSNR